MTHSRDRSCLSVVSADALSLLPWFNAYNQCKSTKMSALSSIKRMLKNISLLSSQAIIFAAALRHFINPLVLQGSLSLTLVVLEHCVFTSTWTTTATFPMFQNQRFLIWQTKNVSPVALWKARTTF